MEKIINKLKELKEELEKLETANYNNGAGRCYEICDFVERIIVRTYPEKDANDLKFKLHRSCFTTDEKTDAEKQKDYLDDIDLISGVIKTIIEEYELLDFDDFKLTKEKTEKEWQIGSDKVGYLRKKITR